MALTKEQIAEMDKIALSKDDISEMDKVVNDSEYTQPDGGEQIHVGDGTIKASVEKNEYNPEQAQKHKWWHPLLNVLPPAGAIIGGLAGEGVASVPLAAGGAMAGEQLKQLIEAMTGQRRRMDAKAALVEAPLSGAIGEGAGQVIGKGFEAVSPYFGKFAGINPETYKEALRSVKGKNSIFRFDNGLLNPSAKTVSKLRGAETDAIEGLKNYPDFDSNQIEQSLNNIKNSYARGEKINPVANRVKPELDILNENLQGAKKIGGQSSGFNSREIQELLNSGLPKEKLEEMGLIGGEEKISPTALHLIKDDLTKSIEKKNGEFNEYKGQEKELLKKLRKYTKDELYNTSPEYKEAMTNMHDLMSANEFSDLGTNAYSNRRGINDTLRLLQGLGLGSAGVAASHGHPLMAAGNLAVEASMSPYVHKLGLKTYGGLVKSKLGGGIGSALYGAVSPEQKAYEEAIRKKITPDGGIPAQQYRNERMK